ncbi:hypothetical protein AK812_SmicGene36172 [Symbiodinium microadriaticum]|uniref:Uncharacterized protein n=1 Tax=Symbiodinium microadriaticum TaxID=2951 RepID=A0A1Q9CJJ9_SYMMI|nr:hypothetical protein AK812_SmicGene36172 [Symbiodinium microadriaticum]
MTMSGGSYVYHQCQLLLLVVRHLDDDGSGGEVAGHSVKLKWQQKDQFGEEILEHSDKDRLPGIHRPYKSTQLLDFIESRADPQDAGLSASWGEGQYMAPDCVHCQHLDPVWKNAQRMWKEDHPNANGDLVQCPGTTIRWEKKECFGSRWEPGKDYGECQVMNSFPNNGSCQLVRQAAGSFESYLLARNGCVENVGRPYAGVAFEALLARGFAGQAMFLASTADFASVELQRRLDTGEGPDDSSEPDAPKAPADTQAVAAAPAKVEAMQWLALIQGHRGSKCCRGGCGYDD